MDSLFGRVGRRAGLAFRGGALTVAGFGAGTYAAFQFDDRIGWIAIMVSLFALDWLRERDKPQGQQR